MKLTQPPLEANLMGAASILRGRTAGRDYKNYILSLMFYKRLSDQWDHEADEAIKELERQQGREYSEPERAIFRRRGEHRSAIPDGSRWGDVKAASTNSGEVLTSDKRLRTTVVEEKLEVQADVAVEMERETKLPAAKLHQLPARARDRDAPRRAR